MLEDIDRRVIQLSIADRRDTIGPPRRQGRTWRAVLFGEAKNRLSNPGLEALRRYAVRFRLGDGKEAAVEKAAVLAAGYSNAQVQSVEDMIRHLQPDPPARRLPYARSGITLVITAVALSIFTWLAQALDNNLIGLIVFGVLAVTVASLFTRGSR